MDNGSTDDSTALEPEFPEIRFMRLPRNFGLTKALNIGIRSAEADYLFLLPWNLKDEITKQMADIRSWGGKFVVPMPSLQVID